MMGVTFIMSSAEKKRQAFPLRAVNGCIVGKNGMHTNNTSGKQEARNDGQGILRCPPGFEHVRSGRDEESGKGTGTDGNRTLQENVAACNESNNVRAQDGACDRLNANNDINSQRKRSASLMDNQGAVQWRRVSAASSSSSGARLCYTAFPAKENSQSHGKEPAAESKRKAKGGRKSFSKRQSGRTENNPKEQMLMTGLDSAVSIPNRDGECKHLQGKQAQELLPGGNSFVQQAQDDNSQQVRVDSIARGLHYILLDSGEIHLCTHNEDCTASSKHVVNDTWAQVDPKDNKAVQGCDTECKRRTGNEFSKEDFHNLLADSFSKFHSQADKTPKLEEEQTLVLPEDSALRKAEESSTSQLSKPVKAKPLDRGRDARQAILDAVSASCAGKIASEHFSLATGKYLAEIEKVLQVVAPSFATSPADCHVQARVYSCCCMKPAELSKIADVPLKSIWEWYEKPSSCGIEVKSCKASVSEQFNAYLVPYLSGLQLFERVPPKERDSSKFDRKAVHHNSLLTPLTGTGSTERLLKPTPAEEASNLSLLYEFFEVEQPQQRMPLLQKIRALVEGNAGISKGDPKTLEHAFLGNLHPASWFAVSWYPIYKIPEGQFRSVFLTYHSLGHVSQGNDGTLSLPVIGLQTYNCQAEHWFSLEGGFEELAKQSMEAMYIKLVVDPIQALRERLSTLDRAAEALSRGMLESPDPKSRSSKHQDYEFFSSRKR